MTMMMVQKAMKLMMVATARWDTTATMKATDVDDDENEGDDASSTTCDEGDNRNCNDGKDACASAEITPAHW